MLEIHIRQHKSVFPSCGTEEIIIGMKIHSNVTELEFPKLSKLEVESENVE
jgi:hypothetical protein